MVLAAAAVWTVFYLVGIIITFFLSSLLFTKKHIAGADYILAAWLLFLGVHLGIFYIVQTGQYHAWPCLLGIEIPLPLLHGPFLFLYTAELTGQFPRKGKWLLHFVPAAVVYAAIAPFLLRPLHEKIFIYDHNGQGYETLMFYVSLAVKLSGIVYVALSLWLLHQYRQRLLHQYSDTEKINLNWLRYLTTGMAAIWLVVLFSNNLFIYATVVVFVLFIGYFGIRQAGILNPRPAGAVPETGIPAPVVAEAPAVPVTPAAAKYQKSKLPQETIDRIHAQLTRAMEEEKLYTNPELTLTDLSKHLQVHPNNLSQVINVVEGKNFYDYVNLFRIAAFEKLLADPAQQQYTLLSLAFDCGFNSKASFNRNFKKYRGLTPTEYQQQVVKNTR